MASMSPPPTALGHPPSPRSASPTRQAKLEAAATARIPRLDSAASTSTAALPPVTVPVPVPVTATATDKKDAPSSRQRRTVRITPPAAHVSSATDSDSHSDDLATERDRLLANHGLTHAALLGQRDGDEAAPLLHSTPTTSAARVAAHRQARRQGMRTSGRTSQRTEFHTPLPWRALTLTVFLFSFGSIALSTSLYLFLGYGHAKDPDKWQPLAVLGSLCMIPGGFYLWHFLMVALGVPGWSYDDIPEL